jgi:hypothetical protein
MSGQGMRSPRLSLQGRQKLPPAEQERKWASRKNVKRPWSSICWGLLRRIELARKISSFP